MFSSFNIPVYTCIVLPSKLTELPFIKFTVIFLHAVAPINEPFE